MSSFHLSYFRLNIKGHSIKILSYNIHIFEHLVCDLCDTGRQSCRQNIIMKTFHRNILYLISHAAVASQNLGSFKQSIKIQSNIFAIINSQEHMNM